MRLKLYTKPGCPLCEEAIELLDEVRPEIDFDLETINILETQELFDRYRYRVPVIRRGELDVLELKFTLEDLKRALS
jgi:glutaredoxin